MIIHKIYFDKDIETVKRSIVAHIDRPGFDLSTRDDIFAGKVKGNQFWIVKTNKFPESLFSSIFSGRLMRSGCGCILSGSFGTPDKYLMIFFIIASLTTGFGGFGLLTYFLFEIGLAILIVLLKLFWATIKLKTKQELICFFQEKLGGEYISNR